ncbi:MAG: hypothetical protein ABIV36_06895 [Sphingobium limneticum]
MANKAKSTQLRKIEVSETGTTQGPWTKVAQLTAAPFATGSAQFLDATNFDSPRKEYTDGLDDVQDMNITFQRVVDDEGQNMLRDACFTRPRPTLYFRGTTGQGEVMTFESTVGGWSLPDGPNAVETAQVTVRPNNIEWTGPEAP